MSKIALSGNVSGTGTLTLAAPNTNSDRTLTLPDNSGTLLSNASTAGFPAGSVLQVVSASTSTQVDVTTTTATDSGLTATITPTSASSKILVLVDQNGLAKTGDTREKVRLLRNGSEIQTLENNVGYTATTAVIRSGNTGCCKLDSPATTSPVTYKTQCYLFDGTGTVYAQIDGAESTITLMEIAA